jgi:hypothetical protein
MIGDPLTVTVLFEPPSGIKRATRKPVDPMILVERGKSGAAKEEMSLSQERANLSACVAKDVHFKRFSYP